MSRRPSLLFVVLTALLSAMLVGGKCSTGGGDSGSGSNCTGACENVALTDVDVQEIIARAVEEAVANGHAATIAVVDRVGNVLSVVTMPGAPSKFKFNGGDRFDSVASADLTGLEGVFALDATLAAISKAGTAAYLSSQGNAFSTRTASQIIQQNFNPGELFRGGGPLFGVQFSQLPCGDFVRRAVPGDATRGPKRMPVGFSADPGGLPLYKPATGTDDEGFVPVGGIGVVSVPIGTFNPADYGLDPDIFDFDEDFEERIATAGTRGVTTSFAAPANRRAERISVDGRTFRFADDENVQSSASDALLRIPTMMAPMVGDPDVPDPSADVTGAISLSVAGFFDNSGGPYQAGQKLGTDASGISDDETSGFFTTAAGVAIDVEILVDASGNNLYDSMAGMDGGNGIVPVGQSLTAMEVRVLLREALRVADRARGQIRKPEGSKARVNFSVVDTDGTLLGFIRSQDAPIFGADVSLQKARTAVFFSRTDAADNLAGAAPPTGGGGTLSPDRFMSGNEYLTELVAFLGDSQALRDGTAFSDRAGGNLSRPFFPDGINGKGNGPFSRPFDDWSPFSTGLQLDISIDGILAALFPLGGDATLPTQCPASGTMDGIANGFQIFPGSVPIYRESQLVGGIGISGDGVDQDDMIAFLGLHNVTTLGGFTINNAPVGIRADNVEVQDVRLRYVSCPPKPFLDSNEQNVCEGK